MPRDEVLAAALAGEFGGQFIDMSADLRRRFGTIWRPRRSPIDFYVLHHSDGARTVDAVWRFHTQTRGWDQGGYHICVSQSGGVTLAVPPSVVSYGAGPLWNDKTLHVVALGDFESGQPPAPMLDSIYRTLCVLDDALGSRPWRAHGALKATACPGQHLLTHLKKMRGASYGAATPRPEHYP